jgi:hypothetical protein
MSSHPIPESSLREHIGELVDELVAERLRVLQWVRVKQLCLPIGPFTKGHVYRLLREGRLRARHVDGIVLVCLRSVRQLIDEGEEWTP